MPIISVQVIESAKLLVLELFVVSSPIFFQHPIIEPVHSLAFALELKVEQIKHSENKSIDSVCRQAIQYHIVCIGFGIRTVH